MTHDQTDAETEAETLQRLEDALRKISSLARQPRSPANPNPGSHHEIDRAALLNALDMLITRLRNGLEPKTE